jgi:1-deoxy-D-xylulose-5-phosphate synthase
LSKQGIDVGVINARSASPIDQKIIFSVTQGSRLLVTLEEGVLRGGFGEAFSALASQKKIEIPVANLGLPNVFIEHGDRKKLFEICGLDPQRIATFVNRQLAALETKTLN